MTGAKRIVCEEEILQDVNIMESDLRVLVRNSMEEILSVSFYKEENADGKFFHFEFNILKLIILLITGVAFWLLYLLKNLFHLSYFYLDFGLTIVGLFDAIVLILESMSWNHTKELINKMMHPIYFLVLLLPSYLIILLFYMNFFNLDVFLEFISISWFIYFCAICVNFSRIRDFPNSFFEFIKSTMDHQILMFQNHFIEIFTSCLVFIVFISFAVGSGPILALWLIFQAIYSLFIQAKLRTHPSPARSSKSNSQPFTSK